MALLLPTLRADASRVDDEPVTCDRHPRYWRAGCTGCRAARAATLLRSVQSCTVHNPADASHQREHVDGLARALVGTVRRTHP